MTVAKRTSRHIRACRKAAYRAVEAAYPGNTGSGERLTDLIDLLADVMHAIDNERGDVQNAIATATGNYEAELAEVG